MSYKVFQIRTTEVAPWLLNIHYAKRIPNIMYAFGLYENNNLVGVITYGMPPTPWLCSGVCGEQWKSCVLELNRLCLRNNKKNEASKLISQSLKLLPHPSIIVSYADTGENHTGYIYQATNFIYTGKTVERTDPDTGVKHARHTQGIDVTKRKKRWSKHRYVYFVGNRKDRKTLELALKYPKLKYPKTPSEKYSTNFNIPTQPILNLI